MSKQRLNGRLDAEALRHVLRYEPESGKFFWLAPACSRLKPGDPAGRLDSKGHVQIGVMGTRFMAHRLAWLYIYGSWPPEEIDHRNCIRSDNRIANLRLANRKENTRNRVVSSRSTSGLKGASVHHRTGKWQASCGSRGEKTYLGLYSSPEEAHAAYMDAAKKKFGEFARG